MKILLRMKNTILKLQEDQMEDLKEFWNFKKKEQWVKPHSWNQSKRV